MNYTHTLQNFTYSFEKQIFKILVAVGIASAFLYAYSLSSVIYGVVERRGLEKEITKLHSDIGIIEAEYLNNSNKLTYEVAQEHGFIKPENVAYELQERVAINIVIPKKNGL